MKRFLISAVATGLALALWMPTSTVLHASDSDLDELQRQVPKKRVVRKKTPKQAVKKKAAPKKTTRSNTARRSATPRRAPPRRAAKPRRKIRRVVRARPRERAPSGFPPAGETRFLSGEVIVRFQLASTQAARDALIRRLNLRHLSGRTFQLAGITAHRYQIASGAAVGSVIRALEASPTVVYAQPNYIYTLQQSDGKKSVPQYALDVLSIGKVPDAVTGEGVKLAIIDSGISAKHSELADANISLHDVSDAQDSELRDGHGTSIAGIVSAQKRLRGVARKAAIVGIRAFAKTDSGKTIGNSWTVARALEVARDQAAKVINMSFAGPNDPLVGRSVNGAARRNMISVAAAGNAGPTAPTLYPAGYKAVIAVTATDAANALYSKANQGTYIAVAAPGVDVLTLTPNGAFGASSGTSLAAAHVSGLAALALQLNGNLNREKFAALLSRAATDLGEPGNDPKFGAGLPDAQRMVQSVNPGS